MRLSSQWLLIILVIADGVAGDDKGAPVNKTPAITAELRDERGKPVSDADVGLFVMLRNYTLETGGDWNFIRGVTSNQSGIARVDRVDERPLIYARHAARQLVGIAKVAGQKPQENLVVTMYPECHVSARLRSNELSQRQRKIEGAIGSVHSADGYHGYFYGADDSVIHAFLPPGKFDVTFDGRNVYEASRTIVIKSGVRNLDLGTVDLVAQKVVLLEGRPAPEIDDVIEWKNGPAVKLSDLREKFVLLEFWGWWCTGCIYSSIPEVVKFQDEFRSKGLVVIGIHTPSDEEDTVDSVAKLDERLATVREKAWNGKDISFPVALTRSRKGRYFPGSPTVVATKMCFDYGIDAFPTTILIDRKGTVVGGFDMMNEESRSRLRKILEAK